MSPGQNNPPIPPAAAMNAASTALKPPEQTLKCPRCDSSNTKFCYYNNYSLTQPRHFCKTCRRYWTKGGALRNVPIGGGCRKSKKSNKSGTSSRLSSSDSKDYSSDYSSSSEISGALNLKYLQTLPTPDFQLGYSRTPYAAAYSGGASCFGRDQIGGLITNYPLPAPSSGMGFMNPGSSTGADIASSIESLSCINQDLHWKLQQQRYAAMAFGGGRRTVQPDSSSAAEIPVQEASRAEAFYGGNENGSGGAAARTQQEWLFGGSINPFTPTAVGAAPPLHNGDAGHVGTAMGNWNGVQWWSDLHQQYGGLP